MTSFASAGAASNWPRLSREAVVGWLLVAAPVAVLVVLILLPALSAVVSSLLVLQAGEKTISLDRYAAFFGDAYSVANLRYTLILTTASSVTAVVLSLGIALYLRFSQGPVSAFIQALALFPLFVPSVVISFALLRFLGPNGVLQLLLETIGFGGYRTPYLTPVGPFIGFVWESLPLPVLVLTAALAQVSNNAIEAARDLGGGSWRILFEVLLPQIKRSLIISFALVFLGTIAAYTIPYVLGPAAPEMMGPFMARTYGNLQQPDVAETQAVIVLMVALVIGCFYLAASARRKARP